MALGRLLVSVLVLLVVLGAGLGCSSEPEASTTRGRTLVMGGAGVRVADAPPELRAIGIAWLEARMRLLSTTTDRKGVVVSTPAKRVGVAMDYIGHADDGAPAVAGAIALDVGGLARLRREPSGGELAAALEGSETVRLARRGDRPKPALTRSERAAIARGVIAAFADGGESPKEAGVEAARTTTRGLTVTTTLAPCDATDGAAGEPCVDGKAPPDGCFHAVCDIEDDDLMAEFAKAFKESLSGAYKNKTCIAFAFAVGLTAVDTAIVINGPTELLVAGGATVLGRKCALSLVTSLIKKIAKKELLDILKNVLCSSRDATLPALPELGLSAPDRLMIDVLNRVGLPVPSSGDVTGTYDAVADVFNTVRQCTCGVASMTDPEVASGAAPVRAQRVVDGSGRVACVPCAAGSHYDPESIECVPDREGDIIAVCADGGDASLKTPCGQSGVEVRVIKPDLCLDVWVSRYTGEQAANGEIPPPEKTTITLPPPMHGGTWEGAAELNYQPSYDACGTGDTHARLEQAAGEDDGPDDGLDYGTVRARASSGPDGLVAYYALLSPLPDASGNTPLFPGHACAKDASGVTQCIDVVPAEYVAHGRTDTYASPGFYWCDYKGSKCRDSKNGGRSVPPPGYAPSYFVLGQGLDTCAVTPESKPAGPPKPEPLLDDCTDKADGVHCSEIEGNEAAGYRCKAGKRVAYTQCGAANVVCVETPDADELVCAPPALSKTDCGDKTDGWWCLDQGTGPGWMAHCRDKQIDGGCSCAACGTAGVPATCSASPPPAACPL
ncbi:MAG: hypothetical protein KF782_34635 [Labilithrix sp.]|nr:hypothetical protein [Labilithrix sp.]